MKQGWQIKKLGSLCSFERGLTYSKGDEVAFSNKGVLRSNNVDLASNTLNFDEIKYLREEIEIPASKKVKRNNLLMCMSNGSKAHLGKVAIIEDDLDFAFGGFMGLLVPDEAIVFPRYFYYALITPIYKSFIKGLSDGANINNLKFANLKEFEIPIPSLSEQQRIVSLLDAEFAKIDTLKANAEQNLQNAKDLFQAALKKELEPKEGWTFVRLNDVFNFIDYRGATPTKLSDGIPLITAKNIKMGYLDYSIKDYISKEEYATRQSRGISHKGDILITTEAPLGNVAMADKDIFSAGQRVITLQQYSTTKHQVLNKFYLYYLLSPSFQEELRTQATGLTALGIKASRLKEIKVPVLRYSDQQSIVSRLDEINTRSIFLQANYEKTIALCDDLKQALLRKAFNGEI